MHLPAKQEKSGTEEVVEVVEYPPPLPPASCLPSKPTTQERKIKVDIVPEKILLKKKKQEEKQAKLLNELETNDLHMKRINSNVNRNK